MNMDVNEARAEGPFDRYEELRDAVCAYVVATHAMQEAYASGGPGAVNPVRDARIKKAVDACVAARKALFALVED